MSPEAQLDLAGGPARSLGMDELGTPEGIGDELLGELG